MNSTIGGFCKMTARSNYRTEVGSVAYQFETRVLNLIARHRMYFLLGRCCSEFLMK